MHRKAKAGRLAGLKASGTLRWGRARERAALGMTGCIWALALVVLWYDGIVTIHP